ncbi:MAG: hypothetical protein J3K34DRAFT_400982 [Monoraphidium minutum]|nr:MAG: hypothetical protein J3K34DRAFT_400982 [Monoraphidium minutum]
MCSDVLCRDGSLVPGAFGPFNSLRSSRNPPPRSIRAAAAEGARARWRAAAAAHRKQGGAEGAGARAGQARVRVRRCVPMVSAAARRFFWGGAAPPRRPRPPQLVAARGRGGGAARRGARRRRGVQFSLAGRAGAESGALAEAPAAQQCPDPAPALRRVSNRVLGLVRVRGRARARPRALREGHLPKI